MTNRPLVLILGASSGPTDELARAITALCGTDAEFHYATNTREAQRAVRREEFTAIVAVESGFMDFCAEMTPELTQRGERLDVIVAHPGDYDPQDLPFGITPFESTDQAAIEVRKAVDYQIGQDVATVAHRTSAEPQTMG